MLNFLISGADPYVRNEIGQHITDTAYEKGRILFLLDHTQSRSDLTSFVSYHVANIMDGNICLGENIFDVSSPRSVQRLRSLLLDSDFTSADATKVVTFLKYIRETENRLGNNTPISVNTIEEYGGSTLVKWKLNQLVENGKLSEKDCEFLLDRYTEVSAAAADFEMLIGLLTPFISGITPTGNIAIYLPLGEFDADRTLQKAICNLFIRFVQTNLDRCTTLILDNGKGERSCLIDVLNRMPRRAEVHLLSTDIFSLEDKYLSSVMNTFPIRIYSRHEMMNSCEKIESCCGYIDVFKSSSTITVDKRIQNNSAFDLLLGTNRTESNAYLPPVREPRYRKETINSLHQGAAVIDCGGTQTLFQF